MDIGLAQDAATGLFALSLNDTGTDLAADNGLRSIVSMLLFTDRRAAPDDVLPDNSGDRRGCWMDGTLGSRLWLLSREKQTKLVPEKAKAYAIEALAVLKEEGVASAISVDAWWETAGMLALHIIIDGLPGGRYEETFKLTIG